MLGGDRGSVGGATCSVGQVPPPKRGSEQVGGLPTTHSSAVRLPSQLQT